MDMRPSFLTASQTWFTSGIIVATLVLMGFNDQQERTGVTKADLNGDGGQSNERLDASGMDLHHPGREIAPAHQKIKEPN